MVCPNCKQEIQENTQNCPICGYSFESNSVKKFGGKQKKPITKKWWFWLIIAIVVIGIIGSASGDKDGGSQSAPAANISESTNTADDTKTTASQTTAVVTTTEKQTVSESEYKASCEKVAYKDIARQPDLYDGKEVVFTGEVVQVQEGILGKNIYRINVTKGDYDIWEDTVYVTFTLPEGAARVLEDDIVTFYGTCTGTYTYTTVLGSSMTIPSVTAKYIDIQ